MLQVYDCITQQHDLRLVIVAGFICFLAAYTAFSLIGRAVESGPKARVWWIGAGAFATGSGVWATHFIAMIAFQTNMPTGYQLGPTVLSILVAMLVSGLGLAVSMMRRIGMPLLGGAIIGAGIGAMHYIGMSALAVPGVLQYDKTYVIAALLIGIIGGGIAAVVGLAKFDTTHRLSAAILLTLGICGLHFTGMAGASIVPDPTVAVPEQAVSPIALAIAVTAVTLMVLCFSLAGAILDEHLVSRSAKEAERLAASETRFRQLTEATFEGIVMHKGGRIVDTNHSMSELLGVPQEALVGRDIMECVTETSRPMLRKYLTDDIDAACEIELKQPDGSLIPAEILARSIRTQNGNGHDTRVLAVRDIRERKEA
jgi:PAS domain S-box-containing protein